MVEVLDTGVKNPLELRHCPVCNQATTFVRFTTLHKDEQKNILESDYRRCLLCLKLFHLELREVENDINSSDIQ